MTGILSPPTGSTILYLRAYPNEYLRSISTIDVLYDGFDLIYTSWLNNFNVVIRPYQLITDLFNAQHIAFLLFDPLQSDEQLAANICKSVINMLPSDANIFLVTSQTNPLVIALQRTLSKYFNVIYDKRLSNSNCSLDKFSILNIVSKAFPHISVDRWKNRNEAPNDSLLCSKHIFGAGGYKCISCVDDTQSSYDDEYSYFEQMVTGVICSPSVHIVLSYNNFRIDEIIIVNQLLSGFIYRGFTTIFPGQIKTDITEKLQKISEDIALNLLYSSLIHSSAIGLDFVVTLQNIEMRYFLVDINVRITTTLSILIFLKGLVGGVFPFLISGEIPLSCLININLTSMPEKLISEINIYNHHDYRLDDFLSPSIVLFPANPISQNATNMILVGGCEIIHRNLLMRIINSQEFDISNFNY